MIRLNCKTLETVKRKLHFSEIKDKKGITLVALIITIIILLILAGITISALTENGLFEKVKLAKEKSENAQKSENITLNEYEEKINQYYNEKQEIKNTIKGRYILFEVYDHIVGDGASISEITIYDINGKKINYNIIENECFDSAYEGIPTYWNWDDHWGYNNLYDNAVNYRDNSDGKYNCTYFIGDCEPNTNNYARFIIDLGEKKEISNINLCLGDVENRTPKSVSAYIIDNYSTNTYTNNVKQRNNEGLTLIKTIEFSSAITTPTWYSFIGEYQSKKILFEVYDHIGSNFASVAEIKIYNKNEDNIIYNIMQEEAFDSATNGKPDYWNSGIWGYTKLYDNNISYTSNADGKYNCTLFVGDSTESSNNYARFIVNVENTDIDDIKICIGDVENRTPKSASAYVIDNYSTNTYTNNVKQRNNEGLKLIKTIEFSSAITTPTWYSLSK